MVSCDLAKFTSKRGYSKFPGLARATDGLSWIL